MSKSFYQELIRLHTEMLRDMRFRRDILDKAISEVQKELETETQKLKEENELSEETRRGRVQKVFGTV